MRLRLAAIAEGRRPVQTRLRMVSAFTRALDSTFTEPRDVSPRRLRELVGAFDEVFHEQLLPGLAADGLMFVRPEELPAIEREHVRRRLRHSIQPLLTPMAVGATHPNPQVQALVLNLAVRTGHRLVYLTMPSCLPRTLALPGGRYLAVESAVVAFLHEVLVDVPVAEHTAFRVTRCPSDKRITRLEVERTASDGFVEELGSRIGVVGSQVYRLRSSLAMGQLFSVDPTFAQARHNRPLLRTAGSGTETSA